MVQSPSESEREVGFLMHLQKLVDKRIWTAKPFPAIDIADIVNALGERIEKWKNLEGSAIVELRAL